MRWYVAVLLLSYPTLVGGQSFDDADVGRYRSPGNIWDADYWWVEGNRHYTGSRLDEAIAAYRKGIEIDAAHSGLWGNLGSALDMEGRDAEAMVAYKRALAIRPDYSLVWLNAGLAACELNDLAFARKAHERLLQLDLEKAEYLRGILEPYGSSADVPVAVQAAAPQTTMVAPPPTPRVGATSGPPRRAPTAGVGALVTAVLYGLLLFALIRELVRYVRRDKTLNVPGAPLVRRSWKMAFTGLASIALLFWFVEWIYRLLSGPGIPVGHAVGFTVGIVFLIAGVYVASAKKTGAGARRLAVVVAFVAMIQILGLSGCSARRAERANTLGIALMSRPDYRGAVEAFGRAVELSPDDPVYHYNLAKAYVGLGHISQARACLRTALRLRPGYLHASELLARMRG